MKNYNFVRHLAILGIIIFGCFLARGVNFTVKQDPNTKKWGIMGPNYWQVKPVWDEIGPEVRGTRYGFGDFETKVELVYPVRLGELWGFINFEGKIKLDPQFDEIGQVCTFEETGTGGRELTRAAIPVRLKGKWGYVEQNGKLIIKPEYDEIGKFYHVAEYTPAYGKDSKEGMVVARKGNEYLILNKKGKKQKSLGSNVLFVEGEPYTKGNDGKWKSVSGNTGKNLDVKDYGNVLYITEENGWTTSNYYYDLKSKSKFFIEKGNSIYSKVGDKYKYGVMENQTVVVPTIFDERPVKEKDLYIVTFNGKKGLFDSVSWNLIVNCNFDEIIPSDNFPNGWFLGTGEDYALVDIKTVELLLPGKYKDFEEIPNSPYIVLCPVDPASPDSELYGVYDVSSKSWLIPLEFTSIEGEEKEELADFLTVAQGDDRLGIYSIKDKDYIVPLANKRIQTLRDVDHIKFVTNNNSKQGVYDLRKRKWIVPQEYYDVVALNSDKGLYFIYDTTGLCGLYDSTQQNVIIPIQYQEFEWVGPTGNYMKVKQNNKYGVVSLNTGKLILPVKYDEINGDDDYDDFKVKINGREGYYDSGKGRWLVDPAIYEGYGFIKGHQIGVKKNGKWGVIDYNGKQVKPFQYASFSNLTGNSNGGRSGSSSSSQFSPSGHDYRYSSDGVTITLEFNSYNKGGHIDWLGDYSRGNAHYRTYFSWSCSNNTVTIDPESLILGNNLTFKFSSDGKSLVNTASKEVYRQIK